MLPFLGRLSLLPTSAPPGYDDDDGYDYASDEEGAFVSGTQRHDGETRDDQEGRMGVSRFADAENRDRYEISPEEIAPYSTEQMDVFNELEEGLEADEADDDAGVDGDAGQQIDEDEKVRKWANRRYYQVLGWFDILVEANSGVMGRLGIRIEEHERIEMENRVREACTQWAREQRPGHVPKGTGNPLLWAIVLYLNALAVRNTPPGVIVQDLEWTEERVVTTTDPQGKRVTTPRSQTFKASDFFTLEELHKYLWNFRGDRNRDRAAPNVSATKVGRGRGANATTQRQLVDSDRQRVLRFDLLGNDEARRAKISRLHQLLRRWQVAKAMEAAKKKHRAEHAEEYADEALKEFMEADAQNEAEEAAKEAWPTAEGLAEPVRQLQNPRVVQPPPQAGTQRRTPGAPLAPPRFTPGLRGSAPGPSRVPPPPAPAPAPALAGPSSSTLDPGDPLEVLPQARADVEAANERAEALDKAHEARLDKMRTSAEDRRLKENREAEEAAKKRLKAAEKAEKAVQKQAQDAVRAKKAADTAARAARTKATKLAKKAAEAEAKAKEAEEWVGRVPRDHRREAKNTAKDAQEAAIQAREAADAAQKEADAAEAKAKALNPPGDQQ